MWENEYEYYVSIQLQLSKWRFRNVTQSKNTSVIFKVLSNTIKTS